MHERGALCHEQVLQSPIPSYCDVDGLVGVQRKRDEKETIHNNEKLVVVVLS